MAEKVRKKVRNYFPMEHLFKTIGIDLIDTKFEFAMEDGELILIDEVLTPDSSRFKISKENETSFNVGYYDKQIVRDALTNEKKIPISYQWNSVQML